MNQLDADERPPQADQDFKYKKLTEEIIKIFYRVYNKLGYGFTDIEVGLLLNFGTKPEVKRKAFGNLRKQFSACIGENLRPD